MHGKLFRNYNPTFILNAMYTLELLLAKELSFRMGLNPYTHCLGKT